MSTALYSDGRHFVRWRESIWIRLHVLPSDGAATYFLLLFFSDIALLLAFSPTTARKNTQ